MTAPSTSPASNTQPRNLIGSFVAASIVIGLLYGVDILPLYLAVVGVGVVGTLLFWRYRRFRPLERENNVVDEADNLDMRLAATLREIAPVALEQLPDPVLILDSTGGVMFANSAADGLIGAASENKQISALVRNPMLLEAAAKVLAGAGQQVIDYSIPGPVECHIRAAFAPIHAFAESTATAENATKPAVLLVLHDLTSIKRSEQMRADFVANTSHELRTPLASLVGFIETLQGPARDDEAARDRFLKIMQMQVGRMGRLIDDLLSLSRIEMNEHVPPSTPVDLIGVVRDVLDTLGPRAQEDEVTLRVTLEGAPFRPQPNQAMAWVLGDRDELVQVVQNLVDNAIKYGGRGGTVTIDLGVARPARTTDGDEAVKAVESQTTYYISVQDRGDGIDRQHLPRLTERFYRVDVQQSREQGGTGLGLAIVKHIVNRHRGSLTIESTIAQGSVFSVFLPTARGPVKTEAPGTPPEGS